MATVEFTLDRFRSILDRIRSAGYTFRAYDDDIGVGDVILRHDVDLSLERAVEMARIERDLDISATYFFLLGTPLYNPFEGQARKRVREIARMDHDVGLHFSTHQHWPESRPSDQAELADRVNEELAAFETIVPEAVSIVSFHAPPHWTLARTFEGFDSTYEPRFFNEIDYIADSGQRWRDEGVTIPDDSRPLQVLMHPGLWTEEDGSFADRVLDAVAETNSRTRAYAETRYLDSESLRPIPSELPEV